MELWRRAKDAWNRVGTLWDELWGVVDIIESPYFWYGVSGYLVVLVLIPLYSCILIYQLYGHVSSKIDESYTIHADAKADLREASHVLAEAKMLESRLETVLKQQQAFFSELLQREEELKRETATRKKVYVSWHRRRTTIFLTEILSQKSGSAHRPREEKSTKAEDDDGQKEGNKANITDDDNGRKEGNKTNITDDDDRPEQDAKGKDNKDNIKQSNLVLDLSIDIGVYILVDFIKEVLIPTHPRAYFGSNSFWCETIMWCSVSGLMLLLHHWPSLLVVLSVFTIACNVVIGADGG